MYLQNLRTSEQRKCIFRGSFRIFALLRRGMDIICWVIALIGTRGLCIFLFFLDHHLLLHT